MNHIALSERVTVLDIRPAGSSYNQISSIRQPQPLSSSPEDPPREADTFQKNSVGGHRKRISCPPTGAVFVACSESLKEPAQDAAPIPEAPAVPRFITMDDGSLSDTPAQSARQPQRQNQVFWAAAPSFSDQPHIRRKESSKLRKKTEVFRAVVQAAQHGNTHAIERLKKNWGYTMETLPAGGTLYVDPYFMSKDLQNGTISGAMFPGVSPSDISTPSLEQRLFGSGKPFRVPDGKGGFKAFTSMKDYRKAVAEARSETLHLPDDGGSPREVNLAFRGGGGKGKRYVPALGELFRLGVVPATVSGTSAGSIAAAIIAAGADAESIQTILRDERFSELIDGHGKGAIAKGEVAYRLFDDVLRDLTGIKDRPVTFADLKMPLTIIAAKYSDSAPPAGTEDFSVPENRIFRFSQETTPNTPVALAVRASMAIPGVFSPVEMMDPLTGRLLALTDGGIVENFPVTYGDKDKPTVGLHLLKRGRSHPKSLEEPRIDLPFPSHQNYGDLLVQNLYNGLSMQVGSKTIARDYKSITDPPENTFVISLPTWDLEDPSHKNSMLSFKYDPEIDPAMDCQTKGVVDNFFREHILNPADQSTKATNIKPMPSTVSFRRDFEYEGEKWTARYTGTRRVYFESRDEELLSIRLKKQRIEEWLIEDASFGDLEGKLKYAMKHTFRLPS